MRVMRRFILAGLLALPLLGYVETRVEAGNCCPCINFGADITIKRWFRGGPGTGPCCDNGPCCGGGCGCGPCCGGGGCCNVGPWYLYWPLDAHFQVPAPTGYPFYPAPMAAGGLPGYAGYPPPAAYPGYGPAGLPYHAANYAPAASYAQYPNYYAPSNYAAQYPGYGAPAYMPQSSMFQTVGYSQQVPDYWRGH